MIGKWDLWYAYVIYIDFSFCVCFEYVGEVVVVVVVVTNLGPLRMADK